MQNDEDFVDVILLYLFLTQLPVYKFAVLCVVIILGSLPVLIYRIINLHIFYPYCCKSYQIGIKMIQVHTERTDYCLYYRHFENSKFCKCPLCR